MDGGHTMTDVRRITIEPDSNDFTGYTVSVPCFAVTGQFGFEEIDIIQGIPRYIVKVHKNRKDNIFPESREEEFIDDKLVRFYKKKGYSLKH